jgi:hypothetical protein
MSLYINKKSEMTGSVLTEFIQNSIAHRMM